ncbi:MAG: hypothetical protein JSR39_03070 [Verrucomicrobia bacterium]|nr:hypothetical protein [Verrucomicrobiota bacterium]
MSISGDLSKVPVQENNALALVQMGQVVEQQEERGEQSPPSSFTTLAIPIEVVTMIFQRLHPRDIARFMMANQEFMTIGQNYVVSELNSPDGKALVTGPIIQKYGFTQITDPRNLVIIQKAFEACYFEGQGEGLDYTTLGAKLQITEDRNLVKLFLRYINDSIPGTSSPFPKEWPEEAEFLRQHPDLNTCCITNVQDIPGAASAIRAWMQNGHPIHTWRLPLFQLSGGDGNHLHDKHMCIITPEVGYFRTDRIDGSHNAFMLVSPNIAIALTLDRDHARHGVGISLDHNHLGALPDEIGTIPHVRELNVQGNDAGMTFPKGT